MLKKIIFYIFIPFFIFSNNFNTLQNDVFNQIIKINENDLKLLNLNNTDINYNNYFYYYCIVSEDLNKINIYNDWFDLLNKNLQKQIIIEFKDLDINNWHQEKQEKLLEFILIYLHNTIFKKYNEHADRISDVIEKQEFNCVSSSILYAGIILKYGFEPTGIETKDHIFIKVKLKNKEIDIETTNKFGFNPGSKKEVLDDFGKITGYTYVPPTNYKDRNEINLKTILFLVYNNLYLYYIKINNEIKAVNIGYIINLGRNDNKGKFLFESFYYNYIITLFSNNKHIEAVSLINLFFKNFWFKDNFIKIKYDILFDFVDKFNNYNDYKEVNDFLLNENNIFNELKNKNDFIKIYYIFNLKVIENNLKNNLYRESYDLIKYFNSLFYFEDVINTFEIIMNTELNSYYERNDFNYINTKLYNLKIQFPEYLNLINRYKNYYSKKETAFLIEKKLFIEALNNAKKYFIDDQAEHKNTLLNCYIAYSSELFKNKDYDNLIAVMDESIYFFPDEKILKNNYFYYLKEIIDLQIYEKNYSKARRFYYIAIEKFSSNSYLIEIDNFLKNKKY